MDFLSIISMYDSLAILSIIALIAAIIVSIVLWVMCVGRKATYTDNTVTNYFRFDHFYVDEILKAVYLFLAIAIAFGSVVSFISAFMVGFDYFFQIAISAIIGFIIAEVILRIVFELLLMFIRIVRDTREIRDMLSSQARGDDTPLPVQTRSVGLSDANVRMPAASDNRTRVPNPVPAFNNPYLQQHPIAQDGFWECPECHHENDRGKFCGTCGAPRPPELEQRD